MEPLNLDPQNVEAEATLLGCLMIDPEAMQHAEHLTPNDFYSLQNSIVFGTIKGLAEEGKPHDKISVALELRASNNFERVNAPESLTAMTLMVAESSAATVRYYVELVNEAADRRRIIEASREIAAVGRRAEFSAFEAESQIQEIIYRMLSVRSDTGTLDTEMHVKYRALYDDASNADKREKLTSPWPSIDRAVRRFKSGELIFWAAMPKVGKSAVLLTLGNHVARHHGAVVLLSLEMGELATMRREVAQLTGISVQSLIEGTLTGPEWERFSGIFDDFDSFLGRYIILGPQYNTIAKIRRALRQVRQKFGSVKTIIVDHVGFVADQVAGRRASTENDRLAYIYHHLRELAGEFSCPLHAVQHLNRTGAKSGLAATMSDIRGGGNAEGIAQAIIFPHRPFPKGDAPIGSGYEHLSRTDQMRVGEFVVEATRDGEPGTVRMLYDGARSLWTEGKLPGF